MGVTGGGQQASGGVQERPRSLALFQSVWAHEFCRYPEPIFLQHSRWSGVLCRSKVDGFVPRIQDVNLRVVGQPE